MTEKRALVIGAGPAGLAAAHELLRRGGPRPCILEASQAIGGLARTETFRGNRIDIGGHRFFSKSSQVMDWWQGIFPVHEADTPPSTMEHLLVRTRKSRIYWNANLFDYPITLSRDTLTKLGLVKLVRSGLSYVKAILLPIRPEKSLEDFFVNRFGRELYATFFRDYTRKVWGIPCERLSPDWGGQRVKGLSIFKILMHALAGVLKKSRADLNQKDVETSLIGRFLYPPLGPGQLWEAVAREIQDQGGEIHFGHTVVELQTQGQRVVKVVTQTAEGKRHDWDGDMVFSSMPVRELVQALGPAVSSNCHDLAGQLLYRDFFTVGLLLDRVSLTENDGTFLKDNWIYVHDHRVEVGRLQFFHNWSPWMVGEAGKFWVGLEYFCNDTDPIWHRSEEDLVAMASKELEILGIARAADVRGGCRIHAAKAYPVYMGPGYERFAEIREDLDRVENLYLVGRNGMHRYNNMDHSMLSAFTAVDVALSQSRSKTAIWQINAENEYHEEKKDSSR